MRLQALVLLTAFAALTGMLHASLFITPPSYYTLVQNSPTQICTPVITTGSSIPSTQGGGAILTSLPANSYVMALVVLAIVLSIMVVAIAYMIGRFFPSSGILKWVNQEYWEIAKSVLIAMMIFAILILLSNVAISVTNTPVTAYSNTDTYLNNLNGLVYGAETYLLTVDSYTAAGWCTIGSVNYGVALLNSFKIEYYLPIPIPIIFAGIKLGNSFNMLNTPTLLAGTDPDFSQFQSILVDLTELYYGLSMAILILIESLPILVWIGLGFFIPLGLVLRALPLVRGIGGTFIALGISISLLLPMVLVVLNYPVTSAFQQILPIQTIHPTSSCNLGNALLNYGCTAFNLVVNELSANVGNGVRVVVSVFWGFSAFTGLYVILNALFPYVVFMILQYILFILDIIIVYAIGDTIAKSLGGGLRTDLGGRLKLI